MSRQIAHLNCHILLVVWLAGKSSRIKGQGMVEQVSGSCTEKIESTYDYFVTYLAFGCEMSGSFLHVILEYCP